jgi:hypothetical protein
MRPSGAVVTGVADEVEEDAEDEEASVAETLPVVFAGVDVADDPVPLRMRGRAKTTTATATIATTATTMPTVRRLRWRDERLRW